MSMSHKNLQVKEFEEKNAQNYDVLKQGPQKLSNILFYVRWKDGGCWWHYSSWCFEDKTIYDIILIDPLQTIPYTSITTSKAQDTNSYLLSS